MGARRGYSLMLHVPAIMQMFVSSVTFTARAQASISNIPPMTGVPGSSPVSAAASGVICPAISSEAQSGGSASHTLSMPKRERSSFEKLFVCRSMSPLPE